MRRLPGIADGIWTVGLVDEANDRAGAHARNSFVPAVMARQAPLRGCETGVDRARTSLELVLPRQILTS